MSCDTFCRGGVNSKYGLISLGLDSDVVRLDKNKCHSFKGVKRTPIGDYLCPLGCVHYPKTKEAAINLKRNGAGRHNVCRQNKFRTIFI
jgi:hypothetical protein